MQGRESLIMTLQRHGYETITVNPDTKEVAWYGKRWVVHSDSRCVVGQYTVAEVRAWLRRRGARV